MKKMSLILGVFVTMLYVLTACEDNATPTPDLSTSSAEKAASVKAALKLMSNSQALERLGFGSPSMFNENFGITSKQSANGARKLSTARQASSNGLSMARSTNDSTDIDDHEECEWTTCATETFEENSDGSYTWTLDYGVDGCEEYGYFMKGKLIETFVENGNEFSGTIEYVGFGDEYSTMTGTETFSGTWEDSGNSEDSTEWDYSGSYEYTEDLTYLYKEDDVEEEYTLKASGKETYDEEGFTQDEGEYTYTASNGDFFSGVISVPLYYSYTCDSDFEDSWVFVDVSGVENFSYQEGDESGEFSINYGDGSCDNIISITENGETYDVDLGEEWDEEWSDEADGEESGS
ncbi:hypothetical protein [Reichenbachiella sp.]|uniref:hypothetical protein n=1 Tax=Reichenbachiella sp. TaxID=2184521 RepID=UPI003BB220D8